MKYIFIPLFKGLWYVLAFLIAVFVTLISVIVVVLIVLWKFKIDKSCIYQNMFPWETYETKSNEFVSVLGKVKFSSSHYLWDVCFRWKNFYHALFGLSDPVVIDYRNDSKKDPLTSPYKIIDDDFSSNN